MATLMQGQPGAVKLPDGQPAILRIGNQGELCAPEMSGKHFEQMLRGRMQIYHCPAQALLLAATTGGHPTLINPANSGVLFVPVALRLGFVSGATVIGSVLIAETQNVGSGAATGSPLLTATLVDSKNALRPGGKGLMQWSPTVNTFTAAPTVIAATEINMGATAPSAGSGLYSTKFDGSLGFLPGNAMSITYSVTTSTALFVVTLWGLEIPMPSVG